MSNHERPIVLDIDGVLADFNSAFVQVLTAQGAPPPPWWEGDGSEPPCWDWPERYANKTQVAFAWHYIAMRPDWWRTLAPHPQFDRAVRMELIDLIDSHPVVFASARPNGLQATKDWLSFWLTGAVVDQAAVVLCPTGRKSMLLAALDPCAVVEDHPSTLLDFQRLKGPSACASLLVARRYNTAGRECAQVMATTGEALRQCAGVVAQ